MAKLVLVRNPPEKPVETKPEAKPVDTPKPQSKKQIIKTGGRRWWLVGIGAAAIVGCFFLFSAMGTNQVFAFIAVFGIISGGIAVYLGQKKHDEGILIVAAGSTGGKKAVKLKTANSLNIYPKAIKFEQLPDEDLKGYPHKCRNDGKYYYVNIDGSCWGCKDDAGILKPLLLPDTQYRDPREYANNINIPAHRRLAQRKASLLEKLSPVIILAAMGILWLIWITTSGSGEEPAASISILMWKGF